MADPQPLSLSLPSSIVWFGRNACVQRRGDRFEVLIGGTLVGAFGPKDYAERNAVLCGLMEDSKVHLG